MHKGPIDMAIPYCVKKQNNKNQKNYKRPHTLLQEQKASLCLQAAMVI